MRHGKLLGCVCLAGCATVPFERPEGEIRVVDGGPVLEAVLDQPPEGESSNCYPLLARAVPVHDPLGEPDAWLALSVAGGGCSSGGHWLRVQRVLDAGDRLEVRAELGNDGPATLLVGMVRGETVVLEDRDWAELDLVVKHTAP